MRITVFGYRYSKISRTSSLHDMDMVEHLKSPALIHALHHSLAPVTTSLHPNQTILRTETYIPSWYVRLEIKYWWPESNNPHLNKQCSSLGAFQMIANDS